MAIGDKRPVVMETDRAAAGGIATLDTKGRLPLEQLPYDVKGTRTAIGIAVYESCAAGETMTITLPKTGVYLIATCNNVHTVALLVTTNNTGVSNAVALAPAKNVTVATDIGSLDITLTGSSTNSLVVSVTTLHTSSSVPVYTGGATT